VPPLLHAAPGAIENGRSVEGIACSGVG